MADSDKGAAPVPPPVGGGLQTTDPTFANQTKSTPKEQKPSSKDDLNKKKS